VLLIDQALRIMKLFDITVTRTIPAFLSDSEERRPSAIPVCRR
jgi:hypothetical protein